MALRNQSSTITQFGYDNASRLLSVTNGVHPAAYTYLANAPLVTNTVFNQNSTTRMTASKSYDYLNRLQQISSAPGASGVSPVTFNYSYNDAGERTTRTETDACYWVYQYDSLLTAASFLLSKHLGKQTNNGQPNRPAAPKTHCLFSPVTGLKMGTSSNNGNNCKKNEPK